MEDVPFVPMPVPNIDVGFRCMGCTKPGACKEATLPGIVRHFLEHGAGTVNVEVVCKECHNGDVMNPEKMPQFLHVKQHSILREMEADCWTDEFLTELANRIAMTLEARKITSAVAAPTEPEAGSDEASDDG